MIGKSPKSDSYLFLRDWYRHDLNFFEMKNLKHVSIIKVETSKEYGFYVIVVGTMVVIIINPLNFYLAVTEIASSYENIVCETSSNK